VKNLPPIRRGVESERCCLLERRQASEHFSPFNGPDIYEAVN
jgi:hypothetical protein